MRRAWWLLAILPACTARMRAYLGVVDDVAPSASAPDLGARDLGYLPPDLTVLGGSCGGDERACLAGGGASERCAGEVFVIDRSCPGESSCAGGFCQPPPEGTGMLGRRCDEGGVAAEPQCQPTLPGDPTCTPFVGADGDAAWYCAKPVGAGGPGSACTAGNACRSGFCGSNGTCFRACQSDCPMVGGTQLHCAPVTIHVEGRELLARSCVP